LKYLDLAKLNTMGKIIVLGTGLVGSAMAADLAARNVNYKMERKET
jgi:predicted dinucleotide-binding enzyme